MCNFTAAFVMMSLWSQNSHLLVLTLACLICDNTSKHQNNAGIDSCNRFLILESILVVNV